jgi:hypothetical protein
MQLAIDCTQKSSSMILLRPWIPDGFYALPKHNLFFVYGSGNNGGGNNSLYKTTLMYLNNILVGGFKHGFYFPSYIYMG